MLNNPVSFIKIMSEDVTNFITTAKERIVFAKPAFLKDEIDIIISLKKQRNITVDLYMEAGDSAIRYGFGELTALKEIHENLSSV